MEEAKSKRYRNIIKGTALVLCIFFFTVPLVQCSLDSSITATGWDIATGSGKLLSGSEGNLLAFIIIIAPVVLLAMAFANKSFTALSNVSKAGLAAKVLFIIVAAAQFSSGDLEGSLQFTVYNWLILAVYIGLCVFANYCARLE